MQILEVDLLGSQGGICVDVYANIVWSFGIALVVLSFGGVSVNRSYGGQLQT